LTVESDGKIIHLPAADDLRIIVTATDGGIMEFDVVDFNLDTDEIESVIAFENISLESGKEILVRLNENASDTRLFAIEDDNIVSEIATSGTLIPIASTTIRLVIDSTTYTINGLSSQSDVAPFIDPAHDRTMVPIRLVAEGLGADVDWIGETRTVTIVRGNVNLTLHVDTPLPDGMGQATILDGRTFVPVRYVSEMLGASVRWDGTARAVYIEY